MSEKIIGSGSELTDAGLEAATGAGTNINTQGSTEISNAELDSVTGGGVNLKDIQAGAKAGAQTGNQIGKDLTGGSDIGGAIGGVIGSIVGGSKELCPERNMPVGLVAGDISL